MRWATRVAAQSRLLILAVTSYANGDVTELFEGGFEVIDDFRGEDETSGRLSDSSRLASLSQKMSRLALSRVEKAACPDFFPSPMSVTKGVL